MCVQFGNETIYSLWLHQRDVYFTTTTSIQPEIPEIWDAFVSFQAEIMRILCICIFDARKKSEFNVWKDVCLNLLSQLHKVDLLLSHLKLSFSSFHFMMVTMIYFTGALLCLHAWVCTFFLAVCLPVCGFTCMPIL